ncbi:hypothetical protein TNCV_4955981 [Trichonephila clavipes]|nr:hypothetical protein TNCV_4955981 [Trichonephila clavipes]
MNIAVKSFICGQGRALFWFWEFGTFGVTETEWPYSCHNILAPVRVSDLRFEPTVPVVETHPVIYFIPIVLSIACTLIYGLLKKPSPTPSLVEDKNDEYPPKRRVMTCIPHQAARNKEARYMPQMVGDRTH